MIVVLFCCLFCLFCLFGEFLLFCCLFCLRAVIYFLLFVMAAIVVYHCGLIQQETVTCKSRDTIIEAGQSKVIVNDNDDVDDDDDNHTNSSSSNNSNNSKNNSGNSKNNSSSNNSNNSNKSKSCRRPGTMGPKLDLCSSWPACIHCDSLLLIVFLSFVCLFVCHLFCLSVCLFVCGVFVCRLFCCC